MKKRLFILAAGLLSFFALQSQRADPIPCHFDETKSLESISVAERGIQAKIMEKAGEMGERTGGAAVRTIPVVVHVIHNGGPENISDIQVQSQIRVLNEDYGKMAGTNGDGNGVDTKMRFCLAQIDPNGNCTNGIVRIQSPLTNHQTYQRNLLSQLSFWDNTRYLNIYVVGSINGNVGGYASFPGGPSMDDGIVVRHNLFGDNGTSTGLGRTTTHEVGHWAGLYHTFQDGCGIDTCLDGDLVCDTPPVSQPNFNCPSNANSCSNDVPNVNDQVENYMDYTSDACQNMFTNGQSLRMEAALDTFRSVIWSAANLASTGCDSGYAPPPSCPVVADLISLNTSICVGNTVDFSDRSLNAPTSWQWSFPGGAPASSTSQNPSVTYASTGSFDVQLIASTPSSADTIFLPGYITVSPPIPGDSLPYIEDFDLGIYPPTGMTINNLDGGITWELDTNASVSGDYSIKINNLINTNYGSADELALPPLDLTTAHPDSHVVMEFKWAYAKSDPTFSDEMLVLISTDCGVSYGQIFYRTQNALATGPTQTTPFIPNANQWRDARINLNNYRNDSLVLLKIVNVTDGGNNLYIEDIYVGDFFNVLLQTDPPAIPELAIFPHPTSETSVLKYEVDDHGPVKITVFDLQGRLVRTYPQMEQSPGSHEIQLDAQGLHPALYVVKVQSPTKIRSIRWLIAD